MLPLSLNITLMVTGYVLVMAYLALGLGILRRRPSDTPVATRRGWPGLVRQVVGTALGGYLLLMAVVVLYYGGVAHLGGRFLASAFTGGALLVGLAVPLFLAVSWVVVRLRQRR